jgi:hypothetical protein
MPRATSKKKIERHPNARGGLAWAGAIAHDCSAQHQAAAATHRLQHSRDQQTADRCRPAGGGSCRDIKNKRADQDRTPPKAVGNRTVEQLSSGNAKKIKGDRLLNDTP